MYSKEIGLGKSLLIAYNEEIASPELAAKGLEFLGGKAAVFKVTHRNPNLNDKIIAGFSFSHMPGCCGIVVSHHTWLENGYRGGEISDKFRELKGMIARDMGYTMMIATNDLENIAGTMNMVKSGYKIDTTFLNKRTGHHIGIGIKRL